MRILKRVLVALISFIVVSAIGGYIYFQTAFRPAPSQLILLDQDAFIPFSWQADSINHELNSYSAMLLPVSLKGCPRKFYM